MHRVALATIGRTAAVVALLTFASSSVGAVGAVEADDIVARTAVPSPEKRHGEVRVIRRGDDTVVQTVLHSRVLGQVLARVASKERANWPAGSDGRADADRYVDALAEAFGSSEAPGGEGVDRRRSLLIEFVHGPAIARVVIARPDVVEDSAGDLDVRGVRAVRELDLSADYVRRNQRLIVEDAFGVDSVAAEALLGSASPR